MTTAKSQKALADLSPFERFVQAILRVPKAAIDEAEAKREKRVKRPRGVKANGD